jgi:alpha-glucosidase (family GH31 glycosyl hydrolase)
MLFGSLVVRWTTLVLPGPLILMLSLTLLGCLPPVAQRATPSVDGPTEPRPPLTPRWAYQPWVWEDETNTERAVRELVEGYQTQAIPVGAVIIDSPWQTNYNTFQFGPNYPDPAALIRDLHARGVKVLLWATGFINVSSIDGPERGKATLYDKAHEAGYFVERGAIFKWWKGMGSAIDFFNPEAVEWWYAQMDQAFALGVDGWKVDNAETSLPDEVETAVGRKTLREYRDAYYRAYYHYVVSRRPEGIIAARPYAFESGDASQGGTTPDAAALAAARANNAGVIYAPVDANPAGWVGDQSPDWAGLEEALDNILASAERGYAVVGSDIGGYLSGRRAAKLFVRWTQLGALSPLMENGGRGEHRPWRIGPDVVNVYRYYARLHGQLGPYLYSLGVEAHRTGQPIIRNVDRQVRQYTLGDDLLVAPVVGPEDERDVSLPAQTRWHDYWNDDRVADGPAVTRSAVPLPEMPLFIRAGAIIPMQVDNSETGHGDAGSSGHLTLLLYPDGESARVYYPDAERSLIVRSHRDGERVNIEIGPQTESYVLRIKEPATPDGVTLAVGGSETSPSRLPTWEAFDAAAEGWYYDGGRRYLWVRFATQDTDARLTYTTPR